MAKTDIGWIQNQGKAIELSHLGERVVDLLGDLYHGIYHLEDSTLFHKRTNWAGNHHIEIVLYGQFSTFDGDKLTALVVMAHDRCLRVTVEGAAQGYLRVMFHPRDRDGGTKHHPTIEEAIERWRKKV